MDNPALEVLAAIPFAREMSAAIRAKLPEGADFAFFLYVPGKPEGRILSIVTSHDVMTPQIAEWLSKVTNMPLDAL